MIKQHTITVETRGRGTQDITRDVEAFVADAGVYTGLCHVFVHHTSASLMLCENADPSVRRDLERFMARLAPDGDPAYEHDAEGPDDMPAHIRSVLTQTGLSLPVTRGRPGLGTWQGIYLWEHRARPHSRQITLTVQGVARTGKLGGSRRPVR
jgi:secondary thiamine-phosphate synthase enzyme